MLTDAQREAAAAVTGPGTLEWDVLSFERTYPSSRRSHGNVDVSFEEDGSVDISWTEPADDFYGTATRQVVFSAEEVDQIISTRKAMRT